jgi:hypothetical protein
MSSGCEKKTNYPAGELLKGQPMKRLRNKPFTFKPNTHIMYLDKE